MQKALALFLILVVGILAVGCNPPTTTAAQAEKPQTAVTPDGTKVEGAAGQTATGQK